MEMKEVLLNDCFVSPPFLFRNAVDQASRCARIKQKIKKKDGIYEDIICFTGLR